VMNLVDVHSSAFARSIANASFRAATSSRIAWRSASMRRSESQIGSLVIPQNAKAANLSAQPALCGRQVCCGFLHSIPSSI
jgi:hypothetical protein